MRILQSSEFESLNYELHDAEITRIVLPMAGKGHAFSMTCSVNSDHWEHQTPLKIYAFEATDATMEGEVVKSDLLGYSLVECRVDVVKKTLFLGTTLRSFTISFSGIVISLQDVEKI